MSVQRVCVLLAVAAFGSQLNAQETGLEARIADILNLPRTVESGRRAGIPQDVIGRALDSLQRRRVPAADAEEILRREIDAVRSGQPKENFGAFVNSQLARGLRGRELANAIHAEHARRGMGASRASSRASDDDVRLGAKESGRTTAAEPERGKGQTGAKTRDERKGVSDTTKAQGKGRRP